MRTQSEKEEITQAYELQKHRNEGLQKSVVELDHKYSGFVGEYQVLQSEVACTKQRQIDTSAVQLKNEEHFCQLSDIVDNLKTQHKEVACEYTKNKIQLDVRVKALSSEIANLTLTHEHATNELDEERKFRNEATANLAAERAGVVALQAQIVVLEQSAEEAALQMKAAQERQSALEQLVRTRETELASAHAKHSAECKHKEEKMQRAAKATKALEDDLVSVRALITDKEAQVAEHELMFKNAEAMHTESIVGITATVSDLEEHINELNTQLLASTEKSEAATVRAVAAEKASMISEKKLEATLDKLTTARDKTKEQVAKLRELKKTASTDAKEHKRLLAEVEAEAKSLRLSADAEEQLQVLATDKERLMDQLCEANKTIGAHNDEVAELKAALGRALDNSEDAHTAANSLLAQQLALSQAESRRFEKMYHQAIASNSNGGGDSIDIGHVETKADTAVAALSPSPMTPRQRLSPSKVGGRIACKSTKGSGGVKMTSKYAVKRAGLKVESPKRKVKASLSVVTARKNSKCHKGKTSKFDVEGVSADVLLDATNQDCQYETKTHRRVTTPTSPYDDLGELSDASAAPLTSSSTASTTTAKPAIPRKPAASRRSYTPFGRRRASVKKVSVAKQTVAQKQDADLFAGSWDNSSQ